MENAALGASSDSVSHPFRKMRGKDGATGVAKDDERLSDGLRQSGRHHRCYELAA